MFSKCDGELQSTQGQTCRLRYPEQPKPQEEVDPDKIQIFARLRDLYRFPEPTS
jgi:hypothetical protein